mgnify:CR=1 FL=1
MSRYRGITLNERLLVSGLLAKFDEAIKTGSQDEAVNILLKTGLRKVEAEETAKAILNNPKEYGY